MKKIDIIQFQTKYKLFFYDFSDFLCENNINYSLAYGTLLGAVREKNMIKWDCDIDIFMFEEEVDKLISIIKATKKYFIQTYKNNELSYGLTRIYSNNLYRQKPNENVERVFIDIFTLGRIKKCQESILNKIKKKQTSLRYWTNIKYDEYVPKSKLKRFFRKFLPSRKFVNKKIDKMYKKVIKGNELVTPLYNFRFMINYANDYLYLPFGKIKMPVYSNYIDYIEFLYKDWQIPYNDHRSDNVIFFYD